MWIDSPKHIKKDIEKWKISFRVLNPWFPENIYIYIYMMKKKKKKKIQIN